MALNDSRFMQQLQDRIKQNSIDFNLSKLLQDVDRNENLIKHVPGIKFDFSKQLIDQDILSLLIKVAQEHALDVKIRELLQGNYVNTTEQRKVKHTLLRGSDPNEEINFELDRIKIFVDQLHAQNIIKNIIHVGIGGSDLGPRLVLSALDHLIIDPSIKINFLSNVDSYSLRKVLINSVPAHTLLIISSKSFKTIETLELAKICKSWMHEHLGDVAAQRIIAITANANAAVEFEIHKDNIFNFWDWVGGRYSIWSSIGLPIAIMLGFANFKKLLLGANQMDRHFATTKFEHNIPVLMALIGIWNINFLGLNTQCIMPYIDQLELLPAYLQQLEMESNGKMSRCHTAPIIWGGLGCNGQHAYMQLLHQGTVTSPVDFIVVKNIKHQITQLHNILIKSAEGQSLALAMGTSMGEPYEHCAGNKPSTMIYLEKLSPEILGSLIACYEHKVFVQSIIWGVQAFDQWGVQLGKKIIENSL